MNPLQIAKSLREDYLKLLTTTFDPRQKPLKEAFNKEINTEGFLTREPYIAISQPYMHESALIELLPETRKRFGAVAEKPYKHQADATRRIMDGKPSVIATGTGSGKTEAFMMPIIDHCLSHKGQGDKVRAIIIYPMNALATDQNRRIRDLLRDSGVTFGRYTGETKLRGERPADSPPEERVIRKEFRSNPPNILLTNYQMLEYMLIRGDGRDIFKDHEISFVVLDEVHSYHGILGTDVSCLLRRLRAALKELNPKSANPLYIGTSATLQSETEGSDPRAGVAEFFTKLTGQETTPEAVITEIPNPPICPPGLKFQSLPTVTREDIDACDPEIPSSVRKLAAKIVGARIDDTRTPEELLSGSPLPYRLLDWLRKPKSLGEIVELLSSEPGRTPAEVGENWRTALEYEIEAALLVGPCLPESCEFKLRPKVHRFLRGLARFWRCVNPDCGALLQEGISVCTKCGSKALPLALCRTCGWDFHVGRYDGTPGSQGEGLLAPWGRMKSSKTTVYVYDPPLEEIQIEAEEDLVGDESDDPEDTEKNGSTETESLFDEDELPERKLGPGQAGMFICPKCLALSTDEHNKLCTCGVPLRPVRLLLGKGTRCPICQSRYGRFDIITPVSLGNSSALTHVSRSVLAGLPDDSRKLLVFCDSRQDAAHQARFVEGIEKHLRLRRSVYELLSDTTEEHDFEKLVEDLYHKYVADGLLKKTNNNAAKKREKALIEGLLLGEFVISPNVRASLERLAMVRVRYAGLEETLRSEEFLDYCETHKLDRRLTAYITPFILDMLRSKRAVSHEALTQRLTRTDKLASQYGLEIGREVGRPAAFILPGNKGNKKWDYELIPTWSQVGQTAVQKMWKHVHGDHVSMESLDDLFKLLANDDTGIISEGKIGSDKESVTGYQINYDNLLIEAGHSFVRCNVCGRAVANERVGGPCPRTTCSGIMESWAGAVSDGNINALLLSQDFTASLLPAEHSASVSDEDRARIEEEFSTNPPTKNMLVCTPTLELGINIGDLEAVAMRNMPPSPANYAQRAGRTGRSSRMGIVAGFSRSTPHDGYFFDHPDEIITGAIPPPRFNLNNLEAIRRHVHSLALESASIDFPATLEIFMNAEGDLDDNAIKKNVLDKLIASAASGKDKAKNVFGQVEGVIDVWIATVVDEMQGLVKDSLERRGNLIKGAAFKKKELGAKIGMSALERDMERSLDDLARRLRSDYKYSYLPRVLAEDGILPGYAFSGDPGSLSLGFNPEPIFTGRVQAQREYAPGQIVYARGGRWQVAGIAMNRPGSVNSSKTESVFQYTECPVCSLANAVGAANNCSRCGVELGVDGVKAVDAGAFRGELSEVEPESEEERNMGAQDVRAHPQRNVPGKRHCLGEWNFELRKQEELWWINHGPMPTDPPGDAGVGFRLCLTCGDVVRPPAPVTNSKRSKKPKDTGAVIDQHAKNCQGKPEVVSLGHKTQADTLRLIVPGIENQGFDGVKWAWSLAYAIIQGAVRAFDIDERDLEPLVMHKKDPQDTKVIEILWIDTIVGGSGILDALLANFPTVAKNALRHLEGHDCPSSCYRCLRSYSNQRQWSQGFLDWRIPVPALSCASLEKIEEAGEVFASAHIMDSPEWIKAKEAGFGSPLEQKLFQAAVDAGLPTLEKQLTVLDNGYLLTVADLALINDNIKLLIYVDGLAFHSSMKQRIQDAQQTKRLTEMGYTVLRFPGPRVYHDVSGCVAEIDSVLHTGKLKSDNDQQC